MVEISESKIDKIAEHAEGAIRHVGKLMQCIEELSEDGHMGERGGYERGGHYGNRHDGGSRYGDRYDRGRDMDDWGRRRYGRTSWTQFDNGTLYAPINKQVEASYDDISWLASLLKL